MKILAIETSCDDTCAAIIKTPDKKGGKFKVLSNIVSSQVKIHKKYGGVFPALAKREHQKNLVPVLERAFEEANSLKTQNPELKAQNHNVKFKTVEKILEREPKLLKKLLLFFRKHQRPDIDLIAVTIGPGLEPCLWVGVNFARALAYYWNLPIIPVNHIEAHIFANFIGKKLQTINYKLKTNLFPAVCLVVSGGHTQIILMKDFGKYKILGETRDDAAGECFDKTARILGLGYPGGPAIATESAKLVGVRLLRARRSRTPTKLPRPMIHSKDYDFSFAGLKTAVLYEIKRKWGHAPLRSAFSRTREGREYIKEMCVEIQQAVIDVLIKKTIKAAKDFKAKTIILGGGVAANEELRKQFNYKLKTINYKLNFLVPPKNLCTDNALMVALAGYFKILYKHILAKKSFERSEGFYFEYKNGKIENWKNVEARANLRI